MINDNKFLQVKSFNDWYYGFTLEDFKKCDVAILTPSNIIELRNTQPELMKFTTIIYLDIPEKIRKERLKKRYDGGKEDDSVSRRLRADKSDFKLFNYFDVRFTTNEDADTFVNNL